MLLQNHAEEWLELIVHGYKGADHRLLLRPLLKPIKVQRICLPVRQCNMICDMQWEVQRAQADRIAVRATS